jgi:DNA-directed RNA polymerase
MKNARSHLMLTVEELTERRFARDTERQAQAYGYGSTKAGLAVAQRYLQETMDVLKDQIGGTIGGTIVTIDTLGNSSDLSSTKSDNKYITNSNNLSNLRIPKETIEAIGDLELSLVALVGLQTTISCVSKQDSVPKIERTLGQTLELEVHSHLMSQWDSVKAKLTNKIVQRRGTLANRRTALKKVAAHMGFLKKPWSDKVRTIVGNWLLECVLETSVFCMSDDRSVCLSEEALSYAESVVAFLLTQRPVLLPVLKAPEPWTKATQVIQGYSQSLVRTRHSVVSRAVQGAIESQTMPEVLKAVNSAQAVPWKLDATIVDLVKWCYENNVSVGAIPPRLDDSRPTFPTDWGSLTEDQQKAYKREAQAVILRNRGYVGERLMFHHSMAVADYIGDQTFWVQQNLDYRGRMYGMTSFQFQDRDYVRGMFRFREGRPIGPTAFKWLAVHAANTGDFGKVSKASFEDRKKWSEDNWRMITRIARDPKSDLRWLSADKPFQFVSACIELSKVWEDPEYICHLPISFDGSCSGLQHLSAMTRDLETGTRVNLVPQSKPQDIYQLVADTVATKVSEDKDNSEVAAKVHNYGISRKLVKRNVMTYAYSSNRFGMAEQLREDTMKPLQHKVSKGELTEHPMSVLRPNKDTGELKDDEGLTASIYIAKHTYSAIEELAVKPAEAMRFLRKIAQAYAHEGKPPMWHTPLGFPVVLYKTKGDTVKQRLTLHNHGVKLRVQVNHGSDSTVIDKAKVANAIAPGFVHSLDACHLQSVVNECVDRGITNVALVHDSFGCLPADADSMREVILRTFCELYENHDVLKDILEEAEVRLDNKSKLPELPEYGDLELTQVLQAEYAFA